MSGGSSSQNAMVKAASRPGATLQQAPGGLKMGEDMPFVCEVCLGPNPYIRMIKMPMSRECKISGRPYTAFRWQPGAEARYKETIIAPEVAIAKNVCQVCLMDMEYNLPVRVRDQLMGAGGERGGIQTPSSDTNTGAIVPLWWSTMPFMWAQKSRRPARLPVRSCSARAGPGVSPCSAAGPSAVGLAGVIGVGSENVRPRSVERVWIQLPPPKQDEAYGPLGL